MFVVENEPVQTVPRFFKQESFNHLDGALLWCRTEDCLYASSDLIVVNKQAVGLIIRAMAMAITITNIIMMMKSVGS